VILWSPTARVLVLQGAIPLARDTEQRVVPSSIKVSVPVATAGDTVAVKVTVCPTGKDISLDLTVVALTGFSAITEATPPFAVSL
jgi:hypothetical protein